MDTNLNNDIQEEKDRSESDEEYKIEERELQYDQSHEEEIILTQEKKRNEKIKKKKPKFINSASIILIVLIFAVISVVSYVPIRENIFPMEDRTEAYIEGTGFINKFTESKDDFIYTLTGLTRYLKQSKIEGQELSDWYSSRYEGLESIKYYIRDRDKAISISNIKGLTEQAQIRTSQFYLRLETDESSNVTIESSLGDSFNKDFIEGLNIRNENKDEYANLYIVYAIPKKLDNYDDLFTFKIKYFYAVWYVILIFAIGLVSSIILTIVAFGIPYSLQSNASICRRFNKMLLEFKLLLIGIVAGVCIGSIYLFDASYSYNSSFNEFFNIVDIIYYINSPFYLIGIPVTFGLYLLIYLSVVYMKHIYHTGFKEGFILNSILGKICFFILGRIKRIFKTITTIDIRKNIYRKLVVVLGINLVVLLTIAFTWYYGSILAIVYTIFLFKYLLNHIEKIKILNDSSLKLAQGDFDIILDEKMGVFTPISENFNKIKDGFKVAIDKETKSQQMKTELISNVSHDLKTPLTSIITYVDLLKNGDVTEENQKEYIDILDRKSKRLKVLIEDLFEASKASSGNIDIHLKEVDVIALFRQTLGELEEKINHSTLQIKMNVPEEKIFCALDGRRTYRIFENIMNNILKYSMANSRVYIDVVEKEKEVRFIFKNIAAYEMNFDATEITERFARGDKSRNTDGSGLGLAIAKSLIELQGGQLSITIDGDLFKLIVIFPKA